MVAISNKLEQGGLLGEAPGSRHWKGARALVRWTPRGRVGISQVDTDKNIPFRGKDRC